MISLQNLHRSYETDQSIIVCPFVTTMGKKDWNSAREGFARKTSILFIFVACKASMSAKSTAKSKAKLGLSSGKASGLSSGKESKSPN